MCLQAAFCETFLRLGCVVRVPFAVVHVERGEKSGAGPVGWGVVAEPKEVEVRFQIVLDKQDAGI